MLLDTLVMPWHTTASAVTTKGQTMNTERETVAETLERLSAGISELTSSEKWQNYLDFQAKFHSYSAGNCMLIALQDPYATRGLAGIVCPFPTSPQAC